jgi:hypothetical protein
MDYKKYFKKNKVKLTREQRKIIKISGILTAISIQYRVPEKIITNLENKIINLICK